MRKTETIEEMIAHRQPLLIRECVRFKNGYTYPVCPKCQCTLNRDYQAYCDRCGQKLSWRRFYRAKIRGWEDCVE